MQFRASKVVSALILLNTTVCLAMQRSIGYDPYKIGHTSITCEDRVYNKLQVYFAISNGLKTIYEKNKLREDLSEMKYLPEPSEEMPFQGTFFFSQLPKRRPGQSLDFVVFATSGKFAKVVTLKENDDMSFYIDCVPSSDRQSPERSRLGVESPNRPQSIMGLIGQSSGRQNSYGIDVSSVNCQGRIYSKLQISEAIKSGIEALSSMIQLSIDINAIRYNPMPTEVMPFQGIFYVSELNDLIGKQPVDLVIFSSNNKFAKVVTQRRDGQVPKYIDCESVLNTQSPDRSPPRMRSPKRPQLRMKSPEREFFG